MNLVSASGRQRFLYFYIIIGDDFTITEPCSYTFPESDCYWKTLKKMRKLLCFFVCRKNIVGCLLSPLLSGIGIFR